MAATAINTQLEILDLRHFSASQLRPLLRDEATRWQRRLLWDYARASETLLEYLDSRILPGYVALQSGRVHGYAFSVFESVKAVIGDVYAFHETESTHNPACDTLLHHLIELLQATPGIDRIESQLLMFPFGALSEPFRSAGFRSCPRLFMTCNLAALLQQVTYPGQTSTAPSSRQNCHLDLDQSPTDRPSLFKSVISTGVRALSDAAERPAALMSATSPRPQPLLQSWQPEFYDPAAAFIQHCYAGHMDSRLNDQYQTLQGCQRFLHNIIRFPGCGIFAPEHSWLVRNSRTFAIEALLLASRVRSDVAHITQLCVDPGLRGHGLGQQLLHHHATRIAGTGVKTLTLTVTEANAPAIALYHRNGFTTLHRFEAMVWDKANGSPQA